MYVDLSTTSGSVGTNLLGGSGTITSVAGVSSGAVSNAQLATATVTSQTLTNATFSANVTADRFISTNNGNAENLKVGDDVWLGDTNVGNTLRIKGQQNAANAYIAFGNNDGATLGRSGSEALTYTAGFSAANLTATSNITAANVVITNASRLGNITSGVWNGSSISTSFTDAKVTSVNGQTGAATGFATTANSLSQFASTTSAQLAGVISDETGSGALVFATSPTLVTPVLGIATGTSVMLSANIGAAAGNVSGNFTAGNFQTTGNVVASNVTVSNQVNFGNATTSVIVYQVYNSTTNSLDTVFI